jgi:hypothetical protein
MPLSVTGQPFDVRRLRQFTDAGRDQHPVPDCLRLLQVRNETEEEECDRHDEQEKGKVGQHDNAGKKENRKLERIDLITLVFYESAEEMHI